MKINRDKLDLLAAAAGMNGTTLAAAAGTSRQNLSTIRTRGTCRAETALKLAHALGVDAEEIIQKEEKGK